MTDDEREYDLSPDELDERTDDETENEEVEEKQEENTDKNKKSISADLIRGHINTIILRSLFDGDRYGYDIISEIEQKSHGQYTLKQPTLYSALKRLEAQGYVKSYWGGVSNGGRRRYFSLTEEGKNVVKQNQSEWEYSRTIIDNLISDEDFDFSKPAPQRLDFRILRQSTSRTPIVSEEKNYLPSEENEGDSYTVVFGEGTKTDPADVPFTPDRTEAHADEDEPVAKAQEPITPVEAPEVPTMSAQATQNTQYAQYPQYPQAETPFASPVPPTSPYMPADPIGQPNGESPLYSVDPREASATQPESTPSTDSKLHLYMQRSAEERNYKDILGKIYRDSIKQREPIREVEPTPPPATMIEPEPIAPPVSIPEPEPEPVPPAPPVREKQIKQTIIREKSAFRSAVGNEAEKPVSRINFSDVKEQAASDGLRIWISDGGSKNKTLPEDYFDKGASLLKAAIPTCLFGLIELLLVFIFRNRLFDNTAAMTSYMIVMLIASLAIPAVCGGLKLSRFQPVCRRFKKTTVLETGFVGFIVLFILLLAIDLLIGVQLTDIPLLMTALVIPGVYLLNILIFSFVYYFVSRSKL